MYLISAQGYTNAEFCFLRVKKTGEIWESMKDAQNMYDLVLKEI